DVLMRSAEPRQRDQLTLVVRAHIDDSPSRAASAYVVARAYVGCSGIRTLRILHRVTAARVQKLPRPNRRVNRINELHHTSGGERDEGQAMYQSSVVNQGSDGGLAPVRPLQSSPIFVGRARPRDGRQAGDCCSKMRVGIVP